MFSDVWSGLGANTTSVSAYSTDWSYQPKSTFRVGEQIYFKAHGPENTGLLVSWRAADGRSKPLEWNYHSTDDEGNVTWYEELPAGTYDYQVVLPVNGMNPDPQAALRFTVGSGAAATVTPPTVTTTQVNTPVAPRVTGTITPGGLSPRSTPSYTAPPASTTYGPDLLAPPIQQTTAQPSSCPAGYNYQWDTNGTAIICAPITSQVAPAGTVPLYIPRVDTSTPRQVPGVEPRACPPGQVFNLLYGYCVPDPNAVVAAPSPQYIPAGVVNPNTGQVTTQPTYVGTPAQPTYAPYTPAAATPDPAVAGSGLPAFLEGDWAGIPKIAWIGGGVLAALMFGRGR